MIHLDLARRPDMGAGDLPPLLCCRQLPGGVAVDANGSTPRELAGGRVGGGRGVGDTGDRQGYAALVDCYAHFFGRPLVGHRAGS